MSASVNFLDRGKEKFLTAVFPIFYFVVLFFHFFSFFQKCMMQPLFIVNVSDTWAVALYEPLHLTERIVNTFPLQILYF